MPNPSGRVADPQPTAAVTAATAAAATPAATGARQSNPLRPIALAVAGVAVIAGIVALVIGLVAGGPVVGIAAGLVIGLLVGIGIWAGVVRPRLATSEQRVLDLVGRPRSVAEPSAGGRDEMRFLNLVEGLAPAAGVARPQCFVIDDATPNALAVGRDARHGCVVVTAGLLQTLPRMELEGVVAHCLVRIRDEAVAGPTVALALGRGGKVAALVADAEARLPSDLAAVSLTRYPPGLAAALRHLAPGDGAAPAAASPLLAPLWLVPPDSGAALVARIDALDEL